MLLLIAICPSPLSRGKKIPSKVLSVYYQGRLKPQTLSGRITICATIKKVSEIRGLILQFSNGVQILKKANVLSSTLLRTESTRNKNNIKPEDTMFCNGNSKRNWHLSLLTFFCCRNRTKNYCYIKHTFTENLISKYEQLQSGARYMLQPKQ